MNTQQSKPEDIEAIANELIYKFQISFNEDALEQDFKLTLYKLYMHGIELGKTGKQL